MPCQVPCQMTSHGTKSKQSAFPSRRNEFVSIAGINNRFALIRRSRDWKYSCCKLSMRFPVKGLGAGQSNLVRVAATRLPTMFGVFDLVGFERASLNKGRTESAFLLMLGNVKNGAPLLRIHSQCFTGEVLGSLRCDCRGRADIRL
jgi:hypothetical protein